LVVDVIDDGPGIPPDQLPHIFDRFHKAEASRTGAGSGLGLAIAAQHVSVLGGSLTAENLERGGARFRVEIPATPQP
jgi:two-component system sensor histidine kinase MtrB